MHGPVSVCLSVCVRLSQVGVLSKQVNRSISRADFWRRGFLRPALLGLLRVIRKFGYLQKIRPHPSGTLSKTLDLKISPQEVVGVLVWSTNSLTMTVSLLITPMTVERVVAECTSLIHVGRL